MSCLPVLLPLSSAEAFLMRLIEKESKRNMSKTYTKHIKYLRINEKSKKNLKREQELNSI